MLAVSISIGWHLCSPAYGDGCAAGRVEIAGHVQLTFFFTPLEKREGKASSVRRLTYSD